MLNAAGRLHAWRGCSGQIGPGMSAREVLWTILKVRDIEFGVLKVFDKERGLEGDIGIASGIYVIGASIKGKNQSGYGAVRTLLEVKEGAFQYVRYDEQHFPCNLDHRLKIRLTDLIAVWPKLPVTCDELASGRNSLNRIRSLNANSPIGEAGAIDVNVVAQLQAWENRNMHLRTAAFWSTFAVLSTMAALLVYFH